MRDQILFEVIRDLSQVKYAYSDFIEGCIICALQRHGLNKDIFPPEDFDYVMKRTIEVFNSIEETISISIKKDY